MNYGRYFRLNQALSKVVDGVAIYDYVDLPAYFGPSEENPMSPKYPISVTITSAMVCFRLHYSAFKLDKSGDCEFPQYAYDIDDINKKTLNREQVNIGMAHMEEVVLELPFSDISSSSLSDTIKNIYNSTFPQVIDENTSMGGRYLEQLIKKRFPVKKDKKSDNSKDSVEDILYKNLRKVSDETASYSTLWLMDLVREDRIYLYSKQKVIDDKTKKENEIDVITGFLRKLLLDFMFDLKHSDVFQNSANYQKMYSGLMSDFYFSALMHKCEYYYYRALTNQAIDNGGDQNKECVKRLYADELFKAEEFWVKDIMSAEAEKNFEYKHVSQGKFWRNFFEINKFLPWPSWFAEPEEEMRRVCFTMEDQTGKKYICNSDVLVKYLKLDAKNNDSTIREMIKTRDTNKEMISRWFLLRYNFNAVLHLHFFKHFNAFIVTMLFIPILLSLLFKWKLVDVYQWVLFVSFMATLVGFGYFLFLIWRHKLYKKTRVKALWRHFSMKSSPLSRTRRQLVQPKIWFVVAVLLVILLCIFFSGYLEKWSDEYIKSLSRADKELPTLMLYFIIAVIIIPFFYYLLRYRHLEARLHLLLPRLVASIALSWITLSMGFDLYVSYFDAPLQWPYIGLISGIVLIFIIYEINRITPNSQTLRKFLRSLELLMVSYVISLMVGLVIINFLGEKYLERGGYIGDYFTQYVENKKDSTVKMVIKNEIVFPNNKSVDVNLNDSCCASYGKAILQKIDSANQANTDVDGFSKKLTEDLVNVYHMRKDQGKLKSTYPVVDTISFMGADLFILRDFLIMFAFIAMFTGIFIQLIIFGDNKQMTEL